MVAAEAGRLNKYGAHATNDNFNSVGVFMFVCGDHSRRSGGARKKSYDALAVKKFIEIFS